MKARCALLAGLSALAAGCGGDGGSDARACKGEMTGAAAATFDCTAIVHHYGEGNHDLEGRADTLFSLVHPPSVRHPDEGLGDVLIGLELPGEPTTGTFTIDQCVPEGTAGLVVWNPGPVFNVLQEATLTIDDLEKTGDSRSGGARIRSYRVAGRLDATFGGVPGPPLTVSATF